MPRRKKIKSPNERILIVFERTDKDVQEFADALGVSFYTVTSWFRPKTNKAWRRAPIMAARLAEELQKHKDF